MVSDFRSLRGDIAFRPLLARQSPAAKIPFQTRRGEKVRNVATPSANVGIRICLQQGLNGIFAIIAALGGALFVLVVVGTVLFGEKIKGGHKLTFPLFSGGGAVASHYGSERAPKLPGTIILVAIFFVCFVLYYFINWKYLSELWLFR